MLITDPMGILLAAMLGLLAVVVLVSLVATFMSLVASVLVPLLAATVRWAQRWVWRDWHPPTDWVPDVLDPQPDTTPGSGSPPVTLVSSHAGDVDVRLVTAQPPSRDEETDPTLTTVHARLAPAATLELPPHARSNMLVCVLSGHGTVGTDHRRVGAGQLAVLGPGTPVRVAADPTDWAEPARRAAVDRPAMEVLVAQVPGQAPETRASRVVGNPPARAPERRTWPAPLRPLGAAVAACVAVARAPRVPTARTRRRPAA